MDLGIATLADDPGRADLLDNLDGPWSRFMCGAGHLSALGRSSSTRGTRRGLSGRMPAVLRDNVRRLGLADLVAPVRPSGRHADPGKHADPQAPIDAYAAAIRLRRTQRRGSPPHSVKADP